MCSCLLDNIQQRVIVCDFFYFGGGRLLAVKGFEKCIFELLHVRSQFDQCLLQLPLAAGHSEPLINEILSVGPRSDV